MYNALDFTQIRFFAGGVRIINKNNMFHSFFQTGKSHFSADFQGQDGASIVHKCTLYNPNDSNVAYSTFLSYKATPTKGHTPSYQFRFQMH